MQNMFINSSQYSDAPEKLKSILRFVSLAIHRRTQVLPITGLRHIFLRSRCIEDKIQDRELRSVGRAFDQRYTPHQRRLDVRHLLPIAGPSVGVKLWLGQMNLRRKFEFTDSRIYFMVNHFKKLADRQCPLFAKVFQKQILVFHVVDVDHPFQRKKISHHPRPPCFYRKFGKSPRRWHRLTCSSQNDGHQISALSRRFELR